MIYFMESGVGGPIKIGFVNTDTIAAVKSRLAQIQAYNPSEVRIVAMLAGTQSLEGALHKRFSLYNIRGEWYRRSEELDTFIREKGLSEEQVVQQQRVCPVCKQSFLPHSKRHNICSKACRISKTCIICGKIFVPETWWKKHYCSIECYHKLH